MAASVKAARAGATASGCEKVFPFFMTAWKHPICVLLELAKICNVVEPSKSGMLKAICGIPPICWGPTGMTAQPVTGTLAFKGQRLRYG